MDKDKRKRVRKIILVVLSYLGVGVIGVLVGAAATQGARVLEPASSLFAATAALDRDLTVALTQPPHAAADHLAMRAQIDRIERTVRRDVTGQANQGLIDQLDQLEGGLWRQNQAYEAALLRARELARTQHDAIEATISDYGNPMARTLTGLHSFVLWTGPALLFTALLVGLLAIALMNSTVREVFLGTGSLSFAGVTLAFKDLGRLRIGVENQIKEVDIAISRVYRSNLTEHDVEQAFAKLKQEINGLFKEELGIDLDKIRHRANLFVPGFAGDELVQATSYYGQKMTVARVGVGRRFSARYGMVGKCWRLGEPLYNASVSNRNNALIREWGLMPKEASEQGRATKSLMGLPLPGIADENPLGVIYLEAPKSALRPEQLSATQLFAGNTASITDDDYVEKVWKEMLKLPANATLVAQLEKLHKELAWDEKVIGEPGR